MSRTRRPLSIFSSETKSRRQAYGNVKLIATSVWVVCPQSETKSRRQAYGNATADGSDDVDVDVRNEVTPPGVWKHPRIGPHTCDSCHVRNEVTPPGVWKPHRSYGRFQLEVRNEVTPPGVWKQATVRPDEDDHGVRNEVTPPGVWKLERGDQRGGDTPPVRNEVTPPGVWKPLWETLDRGDVEVRNEVTPAGVWKRSSIARNWSILVPETKSRRLSGVWKLSPTGWPHPGLSRGRARNGVTPAGVWKRVAAVGIHAVQEVRNDLTPGRRMETG